MSKPFKFTLPSPNFNKKQDACKPKPHYLTPSGMSLLPREKQPPPMYGKHGATVPARYLPRQPCENLQVHLITKTPVEKQFCESCELEFHSMDDLKRHKAQHEKCPVDGCNYKGHSSVMDKHINALHASGLFEKFKKLSTPEEIAAWRDERRKRYPTLANVLLKQKAKEQRQKRGERLETNKNRFGKVDDRKRAQPSIQDKNHNEAKRSKDENAMHNKNNKRNRKNKRKYNVKSQEKNLVQSIEVKKDVEENQVPKEIQPLRCGIKMFAGTLQLKDYKHFKDKKKAAKNNILFGLVGMYGSDDDEDESDEDNYKDDEEKQIKVKDMTLGNEDKSEDNISRNVELNIEANTNKFNSFEEIQVDHTKNTIEDFQLSSDPKEIPTHDIKTGDSNADNLSSNKQICPLTEEIKPKLTHQLNSSNFSISSKFNDDNSSDEGPEEAPIQKTLTDLPLQTETTLKPLLKIEPSIKRSKIEEPTTTSKQRHLTKRKYGLDYRKARLRKQNTMLEKLLEVDIRHERNILLQCVRYVCENNFFGIEQNSPEMPG